MNVLNSGSELVIGFRNCSEFQAAIVLHKANKAYLLKIFHVFYVLWFFTMLKILKTCAYS